LIVIGSLTLDQLRVLVAIDDSGSFSAAGRQLRRVQQRQAWLLVPPPLA
jgi:hypothetical protein